MNRRAYLTASTAAITGIAGCIAGCIMSMIPPPRTEPGTITSREQGERAPELDGTVSVQGAWPTSQFNAQNTGHTPTASGPGSFPQVKWRTQLDIETIADAYREVHSAPAVADGVLYLTARTGTLFALDAATGAVVWRLETGLANAFTPTVVGDVVYFSAHTNIVAATTSGDHLWTAPNTTFRPGVPAAQFYLPSAPTVANGVVYAGNNDGTVFALDAATGAERWRYHVPIPDPSHEWEANNRNSFEGSPAVAKGTVYVGGRNHVVYALDADTGELTWERDLSHEIIGAVTVANDTVYATTQTDVVALDPTDGRIRWRLNDGVNYRVAQGSPAVVGDRLFVSTGNALENLHVAALDAADGRVLWKRPGVINLASSPCATRETVWFAVGRDTIAYDVESGAERWRLRRSRSSTTGSPAVVGGVVFVADTNGYVFAVA